MNDADYIAELIRKLEKSEEYYLQASNDLLAFVMELETFLQGFKEDPGTSDLDDEQPISVRVTLGDYRKAWRVYSDWRTRK